MKMEHKLKTDFGNASLRKDGYYIITSSKEGNNGKLLHRLIWEKHYGKIPCGYIVHHSNGIKTDNSIGNLQVLKASTHNSLHASGENHPMYGKQHSESTRKKMAKNHSDVSCENHPNWGNSIIEEWGGLWFLKEMKKQVGTLARLEEYTGISIGAIVKYLKVRGYRWTTLVEEYGGESDA